MRTKTLLFLLLLSCGVLNAQDTIKTLVITEARLDDARHPYVEITNMGATAVNLAQFELGQVGAWTQPYAPGAGFWMMLPDRDLEPGESFVVAAVYDWNPKMWLKDPDNYSRILNKKEFWTLADLQFHFPESPIQPNAMDSVTPHYHILETWSGRDCIYLRHHLSETDSVVVDQVNGVFANADGTRAEPKLAIDVAGVTNATNEATLIRKFSVKKGNTDFEAGRGQDAGESEWMPVPLQLGHWEMFRTLFWTAGNHGDYNLDPTTITSTTIEISWEDSTLIVPWGIRNDDSIMAEFDKKPGIAWHYAYSPSYEDSAHISARTGDILTLYAAGNDLDMINFKITVAEPTEDANMVIPIVPFDEDGFYAGQGAMYMVSAHKDGVMDTIQGDYRGIGYASRVDTLFKYLEKAPAASWEIVWVDGNVRTDLKTGDILRVTAENGDPKDYFIKVDKYRPSHDANLSSITWPDIPEFYKGLFGWLGDTIPNFVPTKYEFKVQVPYDVPGIPALVGKNADINAKNVVTRAKNLTGSVEDRTITFTSTAEDDTTIRVYNILLEKEKALDDIQTWDFEPFISQLIWNEQWSNTFMEIANPGPLVLDLSNYMICSGYNVTSPVDAITKNALPENWRDRYQKYIPGYKWKDEASWAIDPATAVQDLAVSPLVEPGDVFVLGDIRNGGSVSGYPWWASKQCDIDFGHNPWGDADSTIDGDAALNQWNLGTWFLFRIDNDSVKLGTKPATDPNDFTLIDVFGSGDGSVPVVGGLQMQQINGYTRKPEIYMGQPEFKGSFGTDAETSEWIMVDRAYYDAHGVGWPDDILLVADGLGSHFMNEYTVYKSTVSSNTLKVSVGYVSPQSIRGVVTDTTVNGFLADVIKGDPDQTLTVKSAADGSILELTDVVMDGDTLIVVSADAMNITKYVITVTDEGLSSDAVLTSDELTVTYEGEEGTVAGFPYGTLLQDVVDGVVVPDNASMFVIDAQGAYVPLQMLNFDTLYVDVHVNAEMFFEVVAENGVTKIVYQLTPEAMETDAFVTSSVFEVDQEASLINLVPNGTTAGGFLANLVPAPGAAMMLIDKFGYERMFGNVVKDDKLVVTAQDGVTTKTYYLQMLGEIPQLAYVLSTVYTVDQVYYSISGAFDESTTVADFLANLTPAPGATAIVTDAEGVENTGSLVRGDKVVVTSEDGSNIVDYEISFPTGLDNQNQNSIKVYPNPTSGMATISGLMSGNRIKVTNIMGVVVLDRNATMDKEEISLQGQRFGLYFITVSNADGIVGRYKLILK